MKKAPVAKPNLRLKEERELRGWSQKYVADEIGADRYYLSRWEHGTASPSPYYRQKLCAVFGKDARELGLLHYEADREPGQESFQGDQGSKEVLSAQLVERSTPIYDPMLPPPLSRAVKLIGRDHVYQHLKQHLCAEDGLTLTAINGLPGVGKTSLAVELSHDEEVRSSFKDGILWAGLGPAPDVFAILNHWGTLLGITAQHAARLKTIEDWSSMLHTLIGQRRLLLIIDDAWRIEAALAFKIGGPHCAYLVTTRFPNIALHFTSGAGEATVLHELNTDDGLELLTRLAPEVVKNEPEGARALVQAVGGLPLALTLMGKYLRAQEHGAQPRRIRTALERLHSAGERLRLTEPLSTLERPAGLPPSMPLSLQTVIALSDRHLEEQEQLALRALSVFPPKPSSFSEEAAVAVSNVPVETLDVLSDGGLLESSGPGRYTLHQTISDYARIHLLDSSVYARMADYYAEFVSHHARELDLLDQEVNNIFAALELARQIGYYDLISVVLTNLGSAALDQAQDFVKAESYFVEALELARRIGDTWLLGAILNECGDLYLLQNRLEEAQAAFQESAAISAQGNQEVAASALYGLARVARSRGELDEARKKGQQSLSMFESMNHRLAESVKSWLDSF